jgi:CzcA family heavy metal efflux pump
MVDRIIQWSLQNRVFVLVAAALLLAWGSWEAVNLPVDVFPELTAPTVTVLTEAHGMAPEEVESQVTRPIETSLNGATGVRRLRSSTGTGISIVWVEFEWGTDIHKARQVVNEKLQGVRLPLPHEGDRPVVAPVSSIMGEILFLALTSDRHSPMDLKTAADWTIRPRLLGVAGVSQVSPTGGETRQYQVVLHPERLAALGLTVDQVVVALQGANQNTSAGFFTEGSQEYLIHGIGRVFTPDDVGETLVAMRGDRAVLVRDVADVTIGAAIKRGEGSHDGRPAVILGVQKQPTANTLDLTKRLDDVLDEIQATLPAGMEIDRHIFRQADFIETAIQNVVAALREGAILVIAIVFLFLAGVRPTAITVLAIPLSLVTAILAMKALGTTINTMTLGGMAIAVGALVDDAIIDVENVVRRLRENATHPSERRRPALTVVYEASREIRGSIVYATVIIILVFLPLFFLSGVEGRLLEPLGFAYIVSLAASLLVALTVTPALCSLVLPGSRAVRREREGGVTAWLKRAYAPLLAAVLPRWKSVTAVSMTVLAGSATALAFAGQAFLPDFNEGTLTLSAVTLPGTSLAESDRLGRLVEQILLAQPEVVATARRTGRAELDEHALGVNSAEIDVGLAMKDRTKDEFLAALRRELASVPGMNVIIGQPISHRIDHMLSGTRANVAVKIFGEDLPVLTAVAAKVQAAMQGVPGVVDLSVEQQADIPLLTLRFDREAIARHGLSVSAVAEAIETAFQGQAVSRVIEGQASFDLVVRYGDEALQDLETVRATLLTTPTGARVPLHALADIRRDRGPSTISRENVQRKVVVQCNVTGGDLRGVVNAVKASVERSVSLPPGVHVEYGGQFESAEAASRTLAFLGLVVVVGIFLVLFVALRSARDAALVMVNLPLALMGGVAGIWLSGGVLSVASMIGFITLFGIATRNGLMLILHIHHLVEHEGVTDLAEAVRRGATERLSPILMTALAAGLALIPLALSRGEAGSEIQAPMAIVILCGLLTSTALNMLVVPALYRRFGAVRAVLSSPSGRSAECPGGSGS